MDEELSIRIKAKLDSGVKRALAGVTSEVKKSDTEIVASGKSAQKARTKAVEQYVSSVRRAEQTAKRESFARAREILQDFKAAEKQKREELAKTLRETQMSERRRAQIIARTEREIARGHGAARAGARDALSGGEMSRGRQRRRQMLGAAGGALLGAAGGAFSAAQRAQGTLGIRSQEELIAAAIDQRQAFIRTSVQAGMSQERQDEVLSRVTSTARGTGVSTAELMEGLNLTQELFSNLDSVVENLDSLAKTSRATGTDFSSLVAFSGEVQRQFGLSAAETEEAIAIVARGAEEGSMAFGDFADVMAAGFAGFKVARGTTGLEALREQQAIAQSLRAGGLAPSVVQSRQSALLNSLSDGNVQARLGEAGVNVLNDAGNVREIADIINQVRNSRALQGRDGQLSSTALRGAFGDMEAGQAVAVLAQGEANAAAGRGPSLTDRASASADAGRATIDETMRRLNADASGRAVNLRAGREASVMENSEQLIDAFAQVAGPLTELQDEFPMLTQAVQALTSVLGGAGAGGVGGGLLSGIGAGGSAAAGTAAAGAYGGVGTLAAAGGAAALALPAALVAGGLAGMSVEGGALSGNTGGGDMFDFWREQFGGPQANSDALLRANAVYTEKTGGGAPVDEANTRATADNTQVLRDHTQALRENTAATRAATTGPDTGGETGL